MRFRAFALLCAAGLLAACDSASEPLFTAPPAFSQAGDAVVASVNTAAQFTVPPEVFGSEVGNLLTVNARKRADGTVTGHYHYEQKFQGETFKFSGRVTCLEIHDGNRAKWGGVILKQDPFSFELPFFIWFQNIDNGQGPGVDGSTIAGFGDEAANEAFCADPAVPRFGPWEVWVGDIRVSATD